MTARREHVWRSLSWSPDHQVWACSACGQILHETFPGDDSVVPSGAALSAARDCEDFEVQVVLGS